MSRLVVVLLLILAAEFVNGWTDAPNAIATVVGTRTLSPRRAVAMAAVFNFLGVMSGTAVASTIAKDIIDPSAVNLTTVGGAPERQLLVLLPGQLRVSVLLRASVRVWAPTGDRTAEGRLPRLQVGGRPRCLFAGHVGRPAYRHAA